MSIASKTARKSAGQQAPKEKVVLTTEFAIKEIRVNRAAKLAVLNVEYIDKLLADYDRLRAELILARAGAADFENQLTNERNDHKDTQAELAALLEKIQPIDTVDPDMEKLSAMLTVLAKYEIIEGNTVVSNALRVLTILKNKADADGVAIHDLMTNNKALEKELLKLGVIVNPNPGVEPAKIG